MLRTADGRGASRRAISARCEKHKITAALGAFQQHAFQGDGAHDAAVDAGDDLGDRGGAEILGDGGEAAPEGALRDDRHEMAAIGGEDLGEEEDFRDALRRGLAVPVPFGIGLGGKASGGRRRGHDSFLSQDRTDGKNFFRVMRQHHPFGT